MRHLSAFLMMLAVICLPGNASAEVALQVNIYNSDDTLSTSVAGENIGFGSMSVLMPSSLKYTAGGGSINPSSHYSYDITINDQTMGSGGDTENGGLGFSASVAHNFNGEGTKTMKHSSSAAVKNGDLKTYSYNNDYRLEKQVSATEAAYSQKTQVLPDSIKSAGQGGTLTTPDQNENDDRAFKGVKSIINVDGKKSASIEQTVLGDTDLMWIDEFGGDPSGCTLTETTKGVLNAPDDGSDIIEMKGKATGLPDQILPPGTVEITTQTYDPNTEDTLNNFEEAAEEFKEEHPDASPELYYTIDQKGYLIEGDNSWFAGTTNPFKDNYAMRIWLGIEN